MTLSTNYKLMQKKPMLIVVYNKSHPDEGRNLSETTDLFLKNHDPTKIIQECYDKITCVYLPDTSAQGFSILDFK